MSRVDRDELLARTDLPALADELLGPRRGYGANVKWPCPTHQPQTGRTPPVSIFTTSRGQQRWHCHACGAGGTAIDLVMATCGSSVRGALDALAARARLHPITPVVRRVPTQPAPSPEGAELVAKHVQRCARLLWTRTGTPVREWLHARGLSDDTLREHAVGADPGPKYLDRPRGLPHRGPAAIFPVHERGQAIYFQARYLDPRRAGNRKYDNPARALVANPRLAHLAPVDVEPGTPVFVCEGLPDALSVRQCGHAAVAVLGVGLTNPALARTLHAHYPDRPLRLAFDADARGTAMRLAFAEHLQAVGHPDVGELTLPDGIGDLNDWLRRDPDALCNQLGAATELDIGAKSGIAVEPEIALEL